MYCLTNKSQMILKKNVFYKGNFTLLKIAYMLSILIGTQRVPFKRYLFYLFSYEKVIAQFCPRYDLFVCFVVKIFHQF